MKELTQKERARFERNLWVENFSEQMQSKLLSSSVLVVGAGGLGSVVLQYLTAAGVGTIGIVEFDVVSQSNLQRQILYSEADIGKPKIEIAEKRLKQIRSDVTVNIYNERYSNENADIISSGYDIIVDCSDNFATRYVIDGCSKRLSIPFVYGSAEQLQGQVALFENGGYSVLYPEQTTHEKHIGVLSPMPGIVGSLEALEVVKYVTGIAPTLKGKLLTINADNYKFSVFKI